MVLLNGDRSIETVRAFDIDGGEILEIIPNTPGMPQAFYKLVIDGHGKGTGKFKKFILMDKPSGHGLGFGDINGNGWLDIVAPGKEGLYLFQNLRRK